MRLCVAVHSVLTKTTSLAFQPHCAHNARFKRCISAITPSLRRRVCRASLGNCELSPLMFNLLWKERYYRLSIIISWRLPFYADRFHQNLNPTNKNPVQRGIPKSLIYSYFQTDNLQFARHIWKLGNPEMSGYFIGHRKVS